MGREKGGAEMEPAESLKRGFFHKRTNKRFFYEMFLNMFERIK